MVGLLFPSIVDWCFYIVSIAKTSSKKIGALSRSMKFPSPEVATYIYKYTIQPCTDCNFHVWAGAPSGYLDMLNKLQERVCRAADPSIACLS